MPKSLQAPWSHRCLSYVYRWYWERTQGDPVEQSLFEDTRYDGQQNNAKCPFRGGVLSGWTKETFVEWSCFFWSYPLWNILVNLNAFNNNRLFQNVSFLNTYQKYWIQTFRFSRKTFCVTCLATEAGSLYLPRVAVAYWTIGFIWEQRCQLIGVVWKCARTWDIKDQTLYKRLHMGTMCRPALKAVS